MLPESLAREIIASHQQRPRNVGPQPQAAHAERANPGCGDQVEVWAGQDGERLKLSFSGKGCAISQASASLMTVLLSGKTPQEAQVLAGQFRAMVLGEAAPAPELGDLAALSGVSRLLSRRRCALLAWDALEDALQQA
ncbi:SUF system NifU family Fe-S cluster assembly protein [Deinococcus irradiatisoli]|uniref:SUF system NifU family Fe-S cluster assembly protein n=1 Tax=Deinococcus irradiatisoli TaxID=2202254 RepID=A0A2Z3JNH1_9DEIO|nr:SUF system NifU family Fe-S cluster assembly protein [Deinococcus irradiatisoli]AWN24620.1 SUF system NifU family Fe-S cluster assembly protein [Deinococcus irradiatisoli]